MKKFFAIFFSIILSIGCAGCSIRKYDERSKSTVTLRIAYQYGLAYEPLIICKENEMIEKAYEERTQKKLIVEWTQMNSGADINTGMASNNLDIGFMGIGPAITGVSTGVGYKIFTGLSGQEHGLMTNDSSIQSLGDLVGSDKQIALVNIGSIQHIILAKALTENGYDAHALDSNIVGLKHPDGMIALESGSVACHLTTNPYIYKERENSSLYEISEIKEVWSVDDSFIVGVASEILYADDPELYDTVCNAISEAISFVNDNPKESAKITCDLDGNSYEDEINYLKVGNYDSKTKGVFGLSQFMFENGFIEKKIDKYTDLVFPNVSGD